MVIRGRLCPQVVVNLMRTPIHCLLVSLKVTSVRFNVKQIIDPTFASADEFSCSDYGSDSLGPRSYASEYVWDGPRSNGIFWLEHDAKPV